MIEIGARKNTELLAILVGLQRSDQDAQEVEEYVDELEALTETLGARVLARRIVKLREPSPRFLMGSGNAESIADLCKELDVDILVFDDELSPAQQRNWEKLTKVGVIDRQEVILDIFAARASTREAFLQIQLATAEYQLPRMKRMWTHLQRQEGRMGIRGGEGEKQIEIDSRLLRSRIAKLKEELVQVRKRRAEQRKQRRKRPVPNAAIVGYTNAGKSSLFNQLTKANVLVEDKLFATLDPTTRRLELPNSQTLLLTDTVGFVRKLPHDLVESFKATLEEAVVADYLIHVVDASSTRAVEHFETTMEVLREIGADEKQMLTVMNKIDLLEAPYERGRLRRRFPDALFISARDGVGLDTVVQAAMKLVEQDFCQVSLRIPHDRHDMVAWVHRSCKVLTEKHENDAVYQTVSVPGDTMSQLAPFVIEPIST